MPRTHFPSRLAEIAFSMDVPDSFVVAPLPDDDLDFEKPGHLAPLAILHSQVAMAIVLVAARPAYADGSMMDWFRFLAEHHSVPFSELMPGHVGDATRHPAIILEGTQSQDGTLLRYHAALLEDGGRIILVQAMCPDELWPSFGERITASVASFTLDAPRGATAPLVPGVPVSA